MVIGDIVIANAHLFPDRAGIVDEYDSLTWKQVNDRVNRLANALLGMGLNKGDRVALLSGNSHQYAELIFAAAKAGLVSVSLNSRFTADKMAYMIDDCQPEAFFTQDKYVAQAEQVAPELARRNRITVIGSGGGFESLLDSYPPEEPSGQVSEQNTFLIQYTTGSTGRPKGIELTHKNWINNCIVRFLVTRVTMDDVYLIPAALYAAGNLGHFLSACFAGVKVVIPVFSAQSFAGMIEKEKVTRTYINPTIYRIVRDYLETTDRRYDLSSLRNLGIGGGQPCSGALLKEILDYFHIQYSNSSKAYGQAEVCSPATFLLPKDVEAGLKPDATEKERKRLESIGKTMANTLFRVVDENDNDVPPGEKGEILLKGDGVMKGYYKRPELSQKALRGGWYHTADMGIIDEDGFLYFVGRKDFLIKSGGFFIAPEELEKAILQHPAVAEAAVIGVPDIKWGEMVRAVVSLKPGMKVSDEELKEHCGKLMPRFQVPKSIIFAATLPREAAYGKVSRDEVIKIYGQAEPTQT